jgi:hypothetical protein
MPEQFEKLTPEERELTKIKPTPVERKEPIELTEEENEYFINLLKQAKEAEKRGDLVTAIQLYEKYKREYLSLREKKEREKEKKEREFKNGELICHYEGKCDSWYPHPQGVIIQIGNKLLLNGKDLLYEGEWDDWVSHPQGVIIQIGNKFLLNGEDLLYEGKWDGWMPHPQGVIIQIGNKFLLNGKYLLYEGECDYWEPHPQGVIIRKGNDWFIYTIKK